MINKNLTFNDLPQVVAELRDEVVGMKVVLLDLQKSQTKLGTRASHDECGGSG